MNTSLELEALRDSGQILAEVLKIVIKSTEVGISTKELAVIADKEVRKLGAHPAFLNYMGYPEAICISVNEQVVHGLPGKYKIQDGDVVSYDFGVFYKGMNTDAARTIIVGQTTEKAKLLLKTTKIALDRGIMAVKAGNRVGDISNAIQQTLEKQGFGVIRDLVGHGIGKNVHEEPNIPNYGDKKEGPILREGQALAIEPMSAMGSYKIITLADGWTIASADRSLTAHFEDTVIVTNDGAEIITR